MLRHSPRPRISWMERKFTMCLGVMTSVVNMTSTEGLSRICGRNRSLLPWWERDCVQTRRVSTASRIRPRFCLRMYVKNIKRRKNIRQNAAYDDDWQDISSRMHFTSRYINNSALSQWHYLALVSFTVTNFRHVCVHRNTIEILRT